MSARVAIIGRPNVGKSTLFNRLVGRKLALVDDEPGVTRDRREGDARLADLAFTIVDTAGLEEGDPETLAGRMRAQTEEALKDCDAILFVVDSRSGLTAGDRHFASAVRRAGKPIIVVANKAEGAGARDGVYEAFGLGLGDPIAFSAEHGEGLGELYDALVAVLPPAARVGEDEESNTEPLILGEEEDGSELDLTKPLRIAVLGRPNAGKSTLINRVLGQERLLTGPEPGITRDFDRARRRMGRAQAQDLRHRRLAPPLARRRQDREARRRRCAEGGQVRRSRGAFARRHDPL